jgi:plasmid stability protein
MKTTLDLPQHLVREMKLRAARDGRKLKDVAADALRAGLTAPSQPTAPNTAKITRDRKTGLPVIQCRRPAARGDEITPQRVASILADQELGWIREPG